MIRSMTKNKQFTKIGNGLLVRAPAKINLSLLVAGKRPDGYHELETIMAKINWYDEILIKHKSDIPKPKSETNIELICKGQYEVPLGEDNLVYKAAKLILEKVKSPTESIRITLTKNIPAGTGLGSGSSDAAATLMGINKYLKFGLTQEKLADLAAQLGSDVAFFLGGPISFCTGRGEKVQKLPKSEFRVFLIVPDVSVSTKRVYENYRHNSAEYLLYQREISEYIKKKKIDLVGDLCANMLQESCFELNTKLRELKKEVERTGIGPMCLSGSGSSMYCIINESNEEKIATSQSKLAHKFGCKSMILNSNSW
jgi:4-diphosphocytidyl-2-C-methyl-D-erythritol kinase